MTRELAVPDAVCHSPWAGAVTEAVWPVAAPRGKVLDAHDSPVLDRSLGAGC